jgi:hypothetical protein
VQGPAEEADPHRRGDEDEKEQQRERGQEARRGVGEQLDGRLQPLQLRGRVGAGRTASVSRGKVEGIGREAEERRRGEGGGGILVASNFVRKAARPGTTGPYNSVGSG